MAFLKQASVAVSLAFLVAQTARPYQRQQLLQILWISALIRIKLSLNGLELLQDPFISYGERTDKVAYMIVPLHSFTGNGQCIARGNEFDGARFRKAHIFRIAQSAQIDRWLWSHRVVALQSRRKEPYSRLL